MKRVLRVLWMVIRPLPQLSAWVRVALLVATLLIAAGLAQVELHQFLPSTWVGWAAVALLLAFVSLFTHAVHQNSQIESLRGLNWKLIEATVDAHEELNVNPPEKKLRNALLCSLRYEVRNGSDVEITLCPIALTVRWKPPGHWRRSELKLLNSRRSWGVRNGARSGDYNLAPRSREEPWSHVLGQVPPELFSQVKKANLVAEVTFDAIGQTKKVERVPLVWKTPSTQRQQDRP